ncbi:MAG TPA: carboxypeptidase regulatory-like domain-containing protein, partial [Bryobacteraceae bacterium]
STVTLAGAMSGSTTADASGNYTFGNLVNGAYTVTPSKIGFAFAPVSQNVTVNGANVSNVNFTASSTTFSLSGTITNGAGSIISLSGGAGSTTADSSGNYIFNNLANGTYTVTPSKTGLVFSPPSQNVTINGASVSGVNFSASSVPTFSLSGTITGGAGATVTLSGAGTGSTTANASGSYSFSGLVNGTYTVTPSKTGLTFTPSSQNATISGANVSGVNFTAKGISLDTSVFKDQSTNNTKVISPSFSTTRSSELLLAFIGADRLSASSNTSVSSVTGAGLTWALVKRTNTQNGTAEIWRAFAVSPLTNVTVTATLNQSVQSSLTVLSFSGVDTTGTNGSGAIGASGGGNAQSGAPTATLVTTRNNSWVFGVGVDYDNPTARTVGANQSLVHQFLSPSGDTYWVQMQNNPTPLSGTSVVVNDTAPTADRYNLSICAVQPAP